MCTGAVVKLTLGRYPKHSIADAREWASKLNAQVEIGVDFETAEAMLNHAKKGLERIYDGYDLEDEMRDWLLKWENEIARIARAVGVAEQLGAPASLHLPTPSPCSWRQSPLSSFATRGRASPSRRARPRV